MSGAKTRNRERVLSQVDTLTHDQALEALRFVTNFNLVVAQRAIDSGINAYPNLPEEMPTRDDINGRHSQGYGGSAA